ETDSLDLPSTWADPDERSKRGFADVAKTEYDLRCGKAATALAGLRVAVQLLSRLSADKKKTFKGQRLGTRAQAALASHRKDVDQHADLYRRQYDALCRLGLPATDPRFKPLLKEDLRYLDVSVARPEGLGESQRKPAWFWGGDRDADEHAARELDNLTQEELRVRWFRALANLERFTEEVDIGHAELDRTVRTHEHMRTLWQTLAARHSSSEAPAPAGGVEEIPSGRRAYALKQA
ncbi:hypothetical protein AURDEDRAFT_46568, partial [Auricularia subglabra TFB-10046 SS5]